MLCLWFSTLLLCHNYYLHVQDIFPCSASDNSWKNKLTSQISINQCHWISCKWGLTIVHLKVKGRMLYKVYKPRVYLHNIELTLKCLINVGWFSILVHRLGIKYFVSFTELFLYSYFVYKKRINIKATYNYWTNITL